MRWKIISALLLVLLVASNLWRFDSVIDKGVTLAYRDQMLFELANQVKTASKICDLAVNGKSETEVVVFMKHHFPGEEPFVKEDGVHMPWLSVALDEQGKASSCMLDELVEHWAKPQSERAE